MKKDYIYQDKDGQFKLMQNATRIGGFVVGDGGIVPSERVLPEQRFAHQPIFRRPPEELVTVFSYRVLPNGDIKVTNKLKKKTTETGVDLEYEYRGGDVPQTGASFLLKNWSDEAKAVPVYPIGGGPPYDNPPPIGNSMEGTSLRDFHWPVFFKDYVWFTEGSDSPAVFYSKIKPNGYETKEIKIAFHDPTKSIYAIYLIYRDTTDYKMVVNKMTAGVYYPVTPERWVDYVQYKADSLEGPWVFDRILGPDGYYIYWTTIPEGGPWYIDGRLSTVVWDEYVLEYASLILSKSHNQLSLAVGDWHADWLMKDVIEQVYAPPFIRNDGLNPGAAVILSRGREGEIAFVKDTPPPGYLNNVRYLVKRLGNGQIQKTFITRLAWPEWVPT